MRAFARLLDGLVYTRSRNAKLQLIADYLRVSPDPDRGYALAALTDELDFAAVKPATVRAMVEARFDPVLFGLSRDYVGDTAETVALMWGQTSEAETSATPTAGARPSLRLAEVVEVLSRASRASAPEALSGLMDQLGDSERFALLKLATRGLRVGVSARLAKTAVAQAFSVPVEEIEEVWHALEPPYAPLFAWLTGAGDRPDPRGKPVFRPFMLAHPLEDETLELSDFLCEWKWDGIRVQLVGTGTETRLFSRGADDITESFPEVAAAFTRDGVLDGELLVRGEDQAGQAASFNALQQRLGRKRVSERVVEAYPAFVRLYDVLFDGGEDLRELPLTARRSRLEALMPELDSARFDLSEALAVAHFDELSALRAGARDAAIEGVMLKRRDSAYLAGRKKGLWYKWKREPLRIDCVMMYAQRGSGKRSSYYSDYTFGCWSANGELLPVGKAYSGFSDEELKELDRFVRNHTVARFGPVREVDKTLVLEVAFDSVHRSKRHKSGLAMRFPRISRIRRDKPAEEADHLDTLERLVT